MLNFHGRYTSLTPDKGSDTVQLSAISHLECSGCKATYDYSKLHTYCTTCGSPLLVRYDLAQVSGHIDRDEIGRRQGRGMWRWQELLPVKDQTNQVSLGEGDT